MISPKFALKVFIQLIFLCSTIFFTSPLPAQTDPIGFGPDRVEIRISGTHA